MREGSTHEYPKSCRDILLRGVEGTWNPSGVYKIKSKKYGIVETYCNMDDYGGGWTLLVTRASDQGWSLQNVLLRNKTSPSLTKDYSVFGIADEIRVKDVFEVCQENFNCCCLEEFF